MTDTSIPACKASAIVGTETHEFLVTKDAFWLWMSPSTEARAREISGDGPRLQYSSGRRSELSDIAPSARVRLPVDGAKPSVLGVRGEPQNQFSIDMYARTFHAVLDWRHHDCRPWQSKEEADLSFFDARLDELSDVFHATAGGRYFELPTPGASDYEGRFTQKHPVYGAREGWGSWPPREVETCDSGRAIIVPVDARQSPSRSSYPMTSSASNLQVPIWR